MKSLLPAPTTSQRLKRLASLLATPAALLLSGGRAEAILTYNIFEFGPDVVVQTNGSLNLPVLVNPGSFRCSGFIEGVIVSSFARICNGGDNVKVEYPLASGPATFNGSVAAIANSSSGVSTFLQGLSLAFGIETTYISGTPMVSNSIYNSTTLAGMGFTTTGLIGTWTLAGTGDTINVVLGPPAAPQSTAVPGPLPLLGAAAAFGWTRRLRRRIITAKTTVAG
jgi:hypothetical protein